MRLVLALCTLAVVATPLRAQPADSARTAEPRRALETLSLRQRIRIETPLEGRLEGRFLGLRDGRFGLRTDETELAVPVDQLRRLWVRGNRAGTGAIVGGAIGAVTGAVLVGTLAEFACAETDESCGFEGAVLGGLMFGAAAAGAGALVGLAIPRWKSRYP